MEPRPSQSPPAGDRGIQTLTSTWGQAVKTRVSPRPWPSHGSRAAGWACAAAVAALGVTVASAAPIAAGGGYSYFTGPAGQRTRNLMAIAAAAPGPVRASVTAVRYDDDTIGKGIGIVAGLGVPVAAHTRLRMWGSRYVGDDAFRAWRVKAGPEANLPGGGALGLFFAHGESNAADRTNAGVAELGMPLPAGVTGRASASYARGAGDLSSAAGSIGLGWALL